MRPAHRATPPAAPRFDWRQAVAGVIALHRQDRLDEAEPLYRQLLGVLPDNPNLLHFYGVLLHQRQRVDEALPLVRRSLALDPKVASWHNNLGNMLLDLQQPGEAAQAYLRCLALEPGNVEVRSNLGCLLRLSGRLDEAEALLREAIALAPDFGNAHANLAAVLADRGQIDAALAAAAAALALQPDNPRSCRLLGLLHAQCGRIDLAEQVFWAWATRCPDDPQARHHLAAASGENVPERASDAYVTQLFDRFAASFDAKLARLGYRAPALCAELLQRLMGRPEGRLAVLDAGCGTGLCGPSLRPYARTLVGVDLSAGMLERARPRGTYDRLEQGELGAWLAGTSERFDLIVSADTLCYFGSLQPLLAAARRAMRPGGRLVFTVEALDEAAPAGCRLLPHGRYAHHHDAVARWLDETGWEAAELETAVLRQEGGRPVQGWLVGARAPDGQAS